MQFVVMCNLKMLPVSCQQLRTTAKFQMAIAETFPSFPFPAPISLPPLEVKFTHRLVYICTLLCHPLLHLYKALRFPFYFPMKTAPGHDPLNCTVLLCKVGFRWPLPSPRRSSLSHLCYIFSFIDGCFNSGFLSDLASFVYPLNIRVPEEGFYFQLYTFCFVQM